MLISTKGRYALRVLLDLAEKTSPGEYRRLDEIAREQEISEKYLESIVNVLMKSGFIEGLRGRGGGYRLTRAPEDYSVYEILHLTEKTLSPVSCLESDAVPCEKAANCKTLPMWEKLDSVINDYLKSVSVRDLIENNLKDIK